MPPLTAPDVPARPRFVGDLNPEAVFLTSAAAPQQRDRTECGVWAKPGSPAAEPPHTLHASHRSHRHSGSGSGDGDRGGDGDGDAAGDGNAAAGGLAATQQISREYRAYLDSIGAFTLPEAGTRTALIDIFFASVAPLLPLLDEAAFRAQHARTAVSLPLLHAVLLVAARHPHAAPHVVGGDAGVRAFAAAAAAKVRALLHGGVERDRLTLARIHALLALHAEGPGGTEAASLQLATAVHHAHSLGLHLDRRTPDPHELALWWSLWALDPLHAALCGRPLCVRREDVSAPQPPPPSPPAPPALQAPYRAASSGGSGSDDGADGCSGGGRPWLAPSLQLAQLLADVIELYRPAAGGPLRVWARPWPPLTAFVPASAAGEAPDTLRLWYHAVAILSHRLLPPGVPAPPTAPASYRRRLDSAHAILALFAARPVLWPPLPLVPYSVALALATFHAALRRDARARPAFVSACATLERLGTCWWFADAIARMGRFSLERVQLKQAAGTLRDLGWAASAHLASTTVFAAAAPVSTIATPAAALSTATVSATTTTTTTTTAAAAAGGGGSEALPIPSRDEDACNAASNDSNGIGPDDEGIEAWFLQFFPDLAAPPGWAGFGDGWGGTVDG